MARKKRRDRPPRKRWIIAGLFGAGAASIVGLATAAWISAPLSDILQPVAETKSSAVYLSDGRTLLGEQGIARENVGLDEIPAHVRAAAVAARRLDAGPGAAGPVTAAARLIRSVVTRQPVEDSSISSQVVHDYFAASGRGDGLQEAAAAFVAGLATPESAALEHHLNTADFGRQATGVSAAAEAYFGKDVRELTLAEGAFLASRIGQECDLTGASDEELERARARWRSVLDGMARAGAITSAEAAAQSFPRLRTRTVPAQRAYLLQEVTAELRRLGYTDETVGRGGLKVVTTLEGRPGAGAARVSARSRIAAVSVVPASPRESRLVRSVTDAAGSTRTFAEPETPVPRVVPASRPRKSKRAACPPTSVICNENALPGNPPSEWDVSGGGDPSIQGYATDISVNVGDTVHFKVSTPATDYRLDIYRIGYYQGNGARFITTVQPSATLPQTQPACLTDPSTGLVDCGNWAESASWAVPAGTVSGVFIAKLVREDGTAGASQIIFVVRDDSRGSDVLVQTSDATWVAYNRWNTTSSLYAGSPAGRAYKVSYNRPVTTRCCNCCNGSTQGFFFDSEYPMVRWLENNGYDVSYTTNVDTARRGQELLEHKIFMSSGHDEYWSNEMRDNVTAARDNGVNLTFFSGNEMFWKTRWENSIDGSATPFRTLVCYKETLANAKIDPSPQWTGSWRDPRFSPPSDGGRPENEVTGTWFQVNGAVYNALTVPYDYAKFRLWRNTSVANLQPGQIARFGGGTLGYEWDSSPNNGTAPAGLVKESLTTAQFSTAQILTNYGSAYAPGTAVHNLTLYKAPSGALVFGAGTTQWSWGLDQTHDVTGPPPDIRMRQATVNLLADLHAQPASPQPDLVPATASTDTTPPTSAIASLQAGDILTFGQPITVSGTATDTGGGVVGGVEVSTDGGNTWFQATGWSNWQYSWTPGRTGPVTVRVRAVDDSGNLQAPATTVSVTVTAKSLWPASTTPAVASNGDNKGVEVGVKFQVSQPGVVAAVRFYKGLQNKGTHIGNLWDSNGNLLATATFVNETASGWQEVDFDNPVKISANKTYIASYYAPNGYYSITRPYFTTDYVNDPLTAPASGNVGGNGVYRYGASSGFPTSSYQATNYWVDVLFSPASVTPRSLWSNSDAPAVPVVGDKNAVTLGVKFQSTVAGTITGLKFYKGLQNTGTHVGSLWTSTGQLLTQVTFTNETQAGWQQVDLATPVTISPNTTYIASYHTDAGYYSVTRPYFTARYVNDPLLALADSEGGDGVYVYGSANTFPTSSFQASNYWVDVVFQPS
ncbi:DUF4082 domain-containing protein [Nonomuraea pusilla]|uniref:Transglycosylase n=1 Tax=Nonomuraea pusilla TaxID=46177 RepID=A0A1H7F8P6_9ACTN|nr:DUF4082 domain-containing protein [Nonomuraea pusilla]SEK22521.1 Transglycosylase [Nonomuraea pusilla]